MNQLKGKVAIVTGSGQGVGRGIARYFAAAGAKVITNNRHPMRDSDIPQDLSPEEKKAWLALRGDAATVAEEIREAGGEAQPYFCDISSFEETKGLVNFAKETYGRVDILVNNAAVTRAGSLLNITEKDWDLETVVKMKGAFNCMKHAVPLMIEQGGGSVLNCASDAWTGVGNMTAYSAANAGIVGLTKATAAELYRLGINCNVYCPQAASPGHVAGFSEVLRTLKSSMGKAEMDPELRAKVDKDHGDAYNLGPFLAYLCTEQGKHISGAVFSVKASGKVELYSEPLIMNRIQKDGLWTQEEFEKAAEELMQGYTYEAIRDQY